jgi:hypothetical protein
MTLFFMIARAIRAAYKALRALVGIMIVTHGAVKWVGNKRAEAAR